MCNITMVVVDDVKAVIDGILSIVPWTEHGIEIVGTAGNGEEGYKLLQEKKPHIVLTDIRMPLLGGIDMVKHLRNIDAGQTKVIFFSGYSDFAYAQESVRLGAFDYLLKPFTSEQILEVVLRAKSEIEAEYSQQMNQLELERKVRESVPYLRQEYMQYLIHHDGKSKYIDDRWDFLDIPLDKQHFIVMIIQIDELMQEHTHSVREVEIMHYAVQNIVEETLSGQTKAIIFREQLSQFIVLMNAENDSNLCQLVESCQQNVKVYAKKEVSLGIGSYVKELNEISHSFEQAKTALSYQFYFGSSSIIYYDDIKEQHNITPSYSLDKENEMILCLKAGNEEGFIQHLMTIADDCLNRANPPSPDAVTNIFYGLAFTIYRMIATNASDEQKAEMNQRLKNIKSGRYTSTIEIINDIKAMGILGCTWMQSKQKKHLSGLMLDAQSYILAHLGEELTVQMCADSVHLSPSYFSNLFKKETGMTFMQYVTNARIEKAKELLLMGMQVQDITYELGYKDRPYFTEIFKKYTGLTPTEFRNKYGQVS